MRSERYDYGVQIRLDAREGLRFSYDARIGNVFKARGQDRQSLAGWMFDAFLIRCPCGKETEPQDAPLTMHYGFVRFTEGAATPSIMIFTHAGNFESRASFAAACTSSARVTSLPKPPKATVTLS